VKDYDGSYDAYIENSRKASYKKMIARYYVHRNEQSRRSENKKKKLNNKERRHSSQKETQTLPLKQDKN